MSKGKAAAVIVGGVVSLAVLYGIFAATGLTAAISRAASLDSAYARAVKAGVPVTAAEVNPMPSLKQEDNAAQYLTDLVRLQNGGIRQGYKDLSTAAASGSLPAVSTALAQVDEAMELAELAGEAKGMDLHRDWDMGPQLLFREYAPAKNAARALCIRARFKAAKGDVSGACLDIQRVMGLSRNIRMDPTMIGALVASSVEAMGIEAMTGVITARPDDASLRARLKAMIPAKPSSLIKSIRSECYMGLTLCRNFQAFGGRKMLQSSDSSAWSLSDMKPANLIRQGLPSSPFDRAQMSRVLEFWTPVFEAAKTQGDDAAIQVLSRQSSRVEKDGGPDSRILQVILPVLTPDLLNGSSTAASRRLFTAYCQVLDARKKLGRWPKTLAEAGVKEVDPYSGQPFVFEPASDGFTLISVGPHQAGDHSTSQKSEIRLRFPLRFGQARDEERR